jgi:ATP-dependent Lon protease
MPIQSNPKRTNRRVVSKPDSSSESSSSSSESEDEVETTKPKSPTNKEADKLQYAKFLAKMFPSKYINDKKKALKKQEKEKESSEEDVSTEEEESSEENKIVEKKKNTKKDKEKEKEKEKTKPSPNLNIFLTVDEHSIDDDDDDWEDEDSDYETEEESSDEDEDVSVSSDEEDEDTSTSNSEEDASIESTSNENVMNSELLNKLIELQKTSTSKTGKPDKMMEECISACKEKIKQITKKQQKKSVKQKEKNHRIFKKMLSVKKLTHELVFFKKMSVDDQKVLIKEFREINKLICVEKPYRLSLLESPIPILHKSIAMKKINLLRSMDEYCSEYYKIKYWVDTFMRIPFGKYNNLQISMKDGLESSNQFMENAKRILDSAVYGLNDAKMQIMQMLGQLITNPNAIGCAVAIKGPPGSGKTSLVKEGISKILNRPFAFIALGGATDSSFLEGHSYTYEGSTWGKIVQILIDSKSMNPVIYFDELDKISDTPKGEEIVGILTHLTDTSQNSQFHDKYFSEIDFDLSKCLFIFSYNDESKVNPILRDRMYRIQTKGYDKKEKTIIANQYLLPKIQEQVKFAEGDIIIPDDVLHYIIEHYCEKEAGVRNQKRCLEIIYTKLNLYRLMRPGSSLFDAEMTMDVSFPFHVTKAIVDKLIKINKEDHFTKLMYV